MNQELFQQSLDLLPNTMVAFCESNGTVVFGNTFFLQFFNLDPSSDSQPNIQILLEQTRIAPGVESYSKNYTDYLLQAPSGDQKSFRAYQKPIGDYQGFYFTDTSKLRELHQKNDDLEKRVILESNQPNNYGVHPYLFLEKEFPLIFNAYSRTGATLSILRISINTLTEYEEVNGTQNKNYLLSEVAGVVKSILRRKEDLIVQLEEDHFLVFLFNTTLWHPSSTSIKKSAEDFAKQIKDKSKSIEIPSVGLRRPMERLELSIGLIESLERETLESILDRSQIAIQTSEEQGELCISVPEPPRY